MSLRRLSCLILGLCALSGCSEEIQWSDSIDIEFDLLRRRDELHAPYVVGAQFQLCADAARDGQLSGLELRAADDAMLDVGPSEASDSGALLCASVIALEPGEVEVHVIDGEDVIASTTLDVRAPDRIELFAAGPLLVGDDELDARVERPRVLAGGTATFEVRYFEGQTRLHGQGALRIDADAETLAEPRGTVVGEDREWIQVMPLDEGEHALALATSAGPLPPVELEVVGEEAIVDVELHGRDERQREEGDPMVVYAQAYGDDDEPIHGVEYEWSLGGAGEPGAGDLFRYDFDPSKRNELEARRGELVGAAEIHAGEGVVDSSNAIGCTIGGRNGGAWALVLALAGVVGRRRRALAA